MRFWFQSFLVVRHLSQAPDTLPYVGGTWRGQRPVGPDLIKICWNCQCSCLGNIKDMTGPVVVNWMCWGPREYQVTGAVVILSHSLIGLVQYGQAESSNHLWPKHSRSLTVVWIMPLTLAISLSDPSSCGWSCIEEVLLGHIELAIH